MSDIVERLNLEHDARLACGQDWSDLLLAAAGEIERLRARVAELEKERDGALADACSARIYASDATVHLRVRVAELEVQLEQSRRLGKLGGYPCTPEHTWAEWLEDRHKRVAELEAAQEWRPIESAPRDRSVLVSNGKYVEKAYWNASPKVWDADVDGCWTMYEPDDYFYAIHLNDNQPTHWMPLPAPPKVAP